MKTNIPTAR